MNFDTKYLIRWGIPGWVFIMLISLPILFLYHDELLKFKIDISKTLGLFCVISFFRGNYRIHNATNSLF